MLKQKRIRFLMVGLAIALLAAALPLAALASESASFGGDDAYDSAAGGKSELALAKMGRSIANSAVSYSGDDAYDLAAGGNPELAFANVERFMTNAAVSYSGDDAYDPAAGGDPDLTFAKGDDYEYVAQAGDEFSDFLVAAPDSSLSKLTGDEFYEYLDADWQPSRSLAMANAAAEGNELQACDTNGYENSLASASGSFSGDDAYDPAAGGTPELSVSAFAGAYGNLIACAAVDGALQ